MSRAGIASDIAERVIGHVIQGVRGVYDRHSYLQEKWDALERLAKLVAQIIAGKAQGASKDQERPEQAAAPASA